MWKRYTYIAALVALTPATGVAKERVRDATVCQIESHLHNYDGKMVRVRGLVVAGLEWFFLKSGDCTLGLAYPPGQGGPGPLATYMPFPEPKTRATFALQRDENYKKFVEYMNQPWVRPEGRCCCIGCDRYEVTVTITGLVEVARPGQPGFGHMNEGRGRLVIRTIANVAAVDISGRYHTSDGLPVLTLPRNMFPGWDLPPSVPPFPNPGPDQK